MIIRVDKCCTFGIRKIERSSIIYLPKLVLNNEIIPAIKDNENFIFLGRSVSKWITAAQIRTGFEYKRISRKDQ